MSGRLSNIKIASSVKHATEYGKLNHRIDQLPSMSKQKIGLFEDTYEFVIKNSKPVKSGKKHKGTRKVGSRNVFDIVAFKDPQVDYCGLGSMKLNEKVNEFRGNKKLNYDPFANAIGSISATGGGNSGGDPDFQFKPIQESAMAKHKIIGSKKNKQIAQPDPYPEQAWPDQIIKYKKMKINT